MKLRHTALAAALLVTALPAVANTPPPIGSVTSTGEGLPGPLPEVGFEQRLGAALPLATLFRDESGEPVELGRYFGERPVILVPVYYECPMLCTLTFNGLTTTLRSVPITAGTDFEVVAYSIDPGETPETAAAAKKRALDRYGRSGAEDGWHFLTGDAPAIQALSQAIGFTAVYDEDIDEYAHAAGLVIATPQGNVARYYFGIEYPARDVRLSLVEASEEAIGSVVDAVLLFCFRYDPSTGRYSALTLNVIRLGGILTLAAMALGIGWMLRREGQQQRSNGGQGPVESLG